MHPCPCCGNRTLHEQPPGTFEICSVCFWEDDVAQFEDPTLVGGANEYSLEEAQAYFAKHGVSHPNALDHLKRPPNYL